jgi:hypothetical protein
MDDIRQSISARDRVCLLCWLTCGSLGAYYLHGTFPTAAFYVHAARTWLDRQGRYADWLAVARLSAIANELARKHADIVDQDWARDDVEKILDGEELNYQSEVVLRVYYDCRLALEDRRIID